jgi:adenylosuccinate lyase
MLIPTSENIIMALVARGVSRQDAHEEIRVLSHEAARNVKVEGGNNDLIERIRTTKFFEPIVPDLEKLLDAKTFIGRCPEQVTRFVKEEVEVAIEKYRGSMGGSGGEVNV